MQTSLSHQGLCRHVCRVVVAICVLGASWTIYAEKPCKMCETCRILSFTAVSCHKHCCGDDAVKPIQIPVRP